MEDIGYGNCFTKLDKILIANIMDKYYLYQKTNKSTYSNFLNPRQIKLVTAYLKKEHIPYSIYEPYPFIEKKIIYFGTYQDFVTFYQGKTNFSITHQQILGTLFSLGLNEDTIGDIIVEDNCFYYTNLSRFNSYLEENLILVNGNIITLQKVKEIVLKEEHFKSFTILVSSMRLDTIVSRISGKSRSQVLDMISDNKILLNYEEIKNASISVKEGDILSIRKVGKFVVGKVQGSTKKQNMILEMNQYK